MTWNSRYRVAAHDRPGANTVEAAGRSGYTLPRRGGRVVECGGLENRYVGNPGVGGSNPPLSAALRAAEHAPAFGLRFQHFSISAFQLFSSNSFASCAQE